MDWLSQPISRRLQIQYVHCTFSSENDVHEFDEEKHADEAETEEWGDEDKKQQRMMAIFADFTNTNHCVTFQWWFSTMMKLSAAQQLWMARREQKRIGYKEKRESKTEKKQTDHYIRCIIKLTSFGSHGMISHRNAQRAHRASKNPSNKCLWNI